MTEGKEPGFKPSESPIDGLELEKFVTKTRAEFARMDPEKAKSILSRYRLAESPEYTPKDSHYAYDLFMAYPATTTKRRDQIVALQFPKGESSEGRDLTVELVLKNKTDGSTDYKRNPEDSELWKKYQEILASLREHEDVKNYT